MLKYKPGRKCGKFPESTKEMQKLLHLLSPEWYQFLASGLSWESTSFRHVSMLLSCFRHVWLCATLWTTARQAPLSVGFSREERVATPSTSAISPSTDRSPEASRSCGASSSAQGKVLLSFSIPNSNSHSPLKGNFQRARQVSPLRI